MKVRNLQLKEALGRMTTPEIQKELDNIPAPDTTNVCGHEAYTIEDELRLLSILNTLKLEPQFYKDTTEQLVEIQDIISRVASKDPYFVAQCIIYSRCMRDGMRTVNHLAAALLTPYLRGQEWAKRFYSGWNKKQNIGGCIYRLDDMAEIKNVWAELNPRSTGKHKNKSLPNSMKKGFASVLENADSYQILKYKKAAIDIANLTHPDISKCKSKVEVDGKTMVTLDALMKGKSISADTWEANNSEAGQLVAQAKREGKITEEQAKEMLTKAKADNFDALLHEGKLNILAAIRNIRNMLKVCSDINALCELLSNREKIKQGKIMPYQIDMAYEIVKHECYSQQVLDALLKGYEASVPNLAEICTGSNLVIMDVSGSMQCCMCDAKTGRRLSSCADKAALIAATLAKATNADVIQFSDSAKYIRPIAPDENIFSYSKKIRKGEFGGTNLASAFKLITNKNKHYDRIFILSDNACNSDSQVHAYSEYVKKVNSPYIYSVDLAAYGTQPLKNTDKVFYYYGYGMSLFEDIQTKEFKAVDHIAKVRSIVI